MERVKVVIGKNFGDEGKGATVHKLCKRETAIVVRHNGGAQAGHTVEDGDFRFVFHQLGSGSRAGCPTYWSHTFLPDLLKLDEEIDGFIEENNRSGSCFFQPAIYAHPDCACTLVFDVLLNSLKETLRGSAKHGSCGMGIYEATLRVQEEAYTLRLKDFAIGGVQNIVAKMSLVRECYIYPVLNSLKEEYKDAFAQKDEGLLQWLELIEDDNLLWNAAEQMYENFHKYVVLKDWQEIADSYQVVVFENAQGLMLDRDNKEYYPHLTPSHTGLYNVVNLLEEVVKDKQEMDLEICYVTRTYVTRHGVGRLDYECAKEDINPNMQDRTNVPNMWQDSLRYAKHPEGDEFWRYIREDLAYLKKSEKLSSPRVSIYVNHLDETDNKILFANHEESYEGMQAMGKAQGYIVK